MAELVSQDLLAHIWVVAVVERLPVAVRLARQLTGVDVPLVVPCGPWLPVVPWVPW
jgi:hypothetical protein